MQLIKTLSILVVCLSPVISFADSFWNHNGSVIRLQAYGNERIMTYEVPSDRMQGAGVDYGTMYFNGFRQGNKYHGTARVFSKHCLYPIEYEVSGTVVNERKIVLKGSRPTYGANCRPSGGMSHDVLEFNHMNSEK